MIYLLRHGQDDEKYVGGWSDTDLTIEGRKQIENMAAYLNNNEFNIYNIYSSDIKRARSTVKIISKELHIKPTYTKKLRELDKGLLTGKIVDNAKEQYPIYFNELDINTKYPNGESMVDLYNRVKLLLNVLLKKDNTLIVTHRGVINMIYILLNDLNLDMNKNRFNVTPASLHELDPVKKIIKRIY